jgi:starch binding protein with CBM20 domain
MKKLIMLATLVALLSVAGNALAVIGWAGNVWPNNDASIVPTQALDTYCQVWKDGVTNLPDAAADIVAVCEVSIDGAAAVSVATVYNGEVGSNDEFTAQIPVTMLSGAATAQVHWKFHDLTDDTWFEGTNDQAGNPAPQIYNVVDVTSTAVNVTFTLCMSGEVTTGVPCVIGSAPEIGGWGTGVNMTNVSGELYEVTVEFPAGSNPTFEYKFKKDDCANWESADNRVVNLPNDGVTVELVLATDSWDNRPIACGLGNTLEEDKVFCLQVCMDGVETLGGVCAIGGVDGLDNWVAGTAATLIGPDLYQVCVPFSAGMAIPLTVEYKFKKDACDTWESVGNRSFVVDNTAAAETTITSTWDDGPGSCGVVGVEETSWDALKSLYR